MLYLGLLGYTTSCYRYSSRIVARCIPIQDQRDEKKADRLVRLMDYIEGEQPGMRLLGRAVTLDAVGKFAFWTPTAIFAFVSFYAGAPDTVLSSLQNLG